VAVIVVLALLAGGGYAAYRGLSGGSGSDVAAKLPLCAKSTKTQPSRVPRAPESKVTIFNASLITGLAAQVAGELKHRNFPVGQIGNAAKVGKGVATIRYSADRKVEAARLAAAVPGATMVQVSGSHVVELDINPKFTALASKSAAAKAFRLAVVQQHLATPSPTPTPTCRPRS
jgi:hypothetical protein